MLLEALLEVLEVRLDVLPDVLLEHVVVVFKIS